MPYRVLFITPYTSGGPHNVLLNYLDGLDPEQVEPVVLAPRPCRMTEVMQAAGNLVVIEPELDTIPRTKDPRQLATYLLQSLQVARRLTAVIHRERIRLVHQCCEAMLAGGLAARMAGIPAAVQVIGMSIFTPDSVGRLWSQVLRGLFDQIYCAQDPILDEFVRFGVPHGHAVLLYNAVIPEQVRERAAGPNPWGDSGDVMRVGMCSVADRRKGPIYFVRAAGEILRRHDNVHFHLLGTSPDDNEHARELAAEVQALGISDRFHFEGFVSDALQRIAHLDVLVQPSESEGLSIAQLEALALAVPMVVSEAGGNKVAVAHDENGFVTPIGDHRAVAEGIDELLHDSSLRGAMGQAGRRRCEAKFSVAANMKVMMRSYRAMLDGQTWAAKLVHRVSQQLAA